MLKKLSFCSLIDYIIVKSYNYISVSYFFTTNSWLVQSKNVRKPLTRLQDIFTMIYNGKQQIFTLDKLKEAHFIENLKYIFWSN